MTNLVVSSDFNLNNPTDFFGDNPVRSNMSSTGFHVYDAGTGNNIYIAGSGIQYNSSGQAVSGTVNSIVCVTGNGQETLFNMTGANISIAYDNSQDWSNFGQELNYWLGSNPTITTIPGGMSGSETINAPSGVNQVYGYTGHNTVVYSAPSTQFTISVNDLLSLSNGTVTVTQGDPLVSNNSNTLHAVQSIQFSDQTIQTSWLTGASTLRQSDPGEFKVLSEMYLAYFNRAPDAVGLDYWTSVAAGQEAGGISVGTINQNIANTFSVTPEAIATFGPVITQQSPVAQIQAFVTAVYTNVLNRAPDQGGLDYWVQAIQLGPSVPNGVSPGGFVTNLIYSVNAQSGTNDSIFLAGKTAVGSYFATTKGLTDVPQSQTVMNTFTSTYNNTFATTHNVASATTAAITAANALTDSYASGSSLSSHPELIVHLVGIN